MIYTKGVPEMDGKKGAVAAITVFLLFFTAISVHMQIVTSDDEIRDTVHYFRGRIPSGAKVLTLNFS